MHTKNCINSYSSDVYIPTALIVYIPTALTLPPSSYSSDSPSMAMWPIFSPNSNHLKKKSLTAYMLLRN